MINLEYIDKMISLAKLNISEFEKLALKEHMETVLDYVEILKEVDIEHEVLVDNTASEAGILRSDEVEASLGAKILLKNAPSEKDGYFIVPNIFST